MKSGKILLVSAMLVFMFSGGSALSCQVENPINGVANQTSGDAIVLEDYKGTDSPYEDEMSLTELAHEIISFSSSNLVEPSEDTLDLKVPAEVVDRMENGDHVVVDPGERCGYSSLIVVDSDGYVDMAHFNETGREFSIADINVRADTDANGTIFAFNGEEFRLEPGESHTLDHGLAERLSLLGDEHPDYLIEFRDPESPDIPGLGQLIRDFIQFFETLVTALADPGIDLQGAMMSQQTPGTP